MSRMAACHAPSQDAAIVQSALRATIGARVTGHLTRVAVDYRPGFAYGSFSTAGGPFLAQLRWIAIQIIAALGLLLAAAENAAAQAHAANDEYAKTIENAVLEFDSGNWPEARVLFEQAHALRPSARTLRGMGKVSFELKEYVRAQKELNAS